MAFRSRCVTILVGAGSLGPTMEGLAVGERPKSKRLAAISSVDAMRFVIEDGAKPSTELGASVTRRTKKSFMTMNEEIVSTNEFYFEDRVEGEKSSTTINLFARCTSHERNRIERVMAFACPRVFDRRKEQMDAAAFFVRKLLHLL